MNTQELIDSWKWRIVRAGGNQVRFAKEVGIARSSLSEYLSGKKRPSLTTFDKIETTLKQREALSDE